MLHQDMYITHIDLKIMNSIGYCRKLRKTQAGRFICLLVMVIFGCCAITVTGLFVRSIKQTEIDDTLNITGDYEAIIFDADTAFADILARSELIEDVGLYYELGTVTDESGVSSFKAVAFGDEISENIYHQTCIRGCYPANENEIAIDVSVANRFGIPSLPGETLSLKMFDTYGELLGSQDYYVSGIFRASNNEASGGWYRFAEVPQSSDYQMPAVFFYSSVAESRGVTQSTVFVRSSAYDPDAVSIVIEQIARSNGYSHVNVEANGRRRFGYSWYLGLDDTAYTRDNVEEALSGGSYNMDVFSSVIFPVITSLVIATEVVSLYTISSNILADRKERYGILRSIGMSSGKIIKDLLIEIGGFGFAGAAAGSGLGMLLHVILVKIFNQAMHLRLPDGLLVDRAVKQVTFDPVIMSFTVCFLSLGLSLIIPVYRLISTYPSELLISTSDMFAGRRIIRKKKKTNIRGGWLGLLNRRIELHDVVTMFVLAVVLSTMLLGYVYFRASSDQKTNEERFYMSLLGVGDNGYTVTLPDEINRKQYNIRNRHDAGIIPSFPEALENNRDVERSWSAMMNDSTRMVFDEEPDEELQQLLGHRMINIRPGSFFLGSVALLEAQMEAEKVIFQNMGYDPETIMYELPTVGLTEKELTGLEGEIIAGSIDTDRIKTGEEAVLAVPEELADICMRLFPVGTSLPIDDILLNDEEEHLGNSFEDPKWICCEITVEQDDGTVFPMSYCSYGRKYSFETTVGAIVVLHDSTDQEMYLTHGIENYDDVIDPQTGETVRHYEYGMSILCLPQTFESWGLPDRNFTSVKAMLKDNADIYEFDRFWYQGLQGSADVVTKSTFDYVDSIKVTTQRVMIIFYFLMSTLTLLGIVSVITGLYTKTRSNLGRFQTLRRVGLSVRQVSIMIYTQNMFYPLIAVLIAVIPVCILQRVFNFLNEQIMNGEIASETWGRSWSDQIPYWTDLFSYNFIPALIVCFLIGILLVVAGTLPQIMYLRKMKMIETREE